MYKNTLTLYLVIDTETQLTNIIIATMSLDCVNIYCFTSPPVEMRRKYGEFAASYPGSSPAENGALSPFFCRREAWV